MNISTSSFSQTFITMFPTSFLAHTAATEHDIDIF